MTRDLSLRSAVRPAAVNDGTEKARGERATAYLLFVDALDLPEDLRGQFLDRECLGDSQLRADVDDLLRLAMDGGTATSALLPMPQLQTEDLLGRSYGRFRLVEWIGEGGMGVVYRAERTDGVKQSVAVKLAARTMDANWAARFESEAQTLARLEHPAVARLIDAGVDNGRAWIAMEFVAGERIDNYCRTRGLATREIIALMVQLADAVSAAHRLLVVHSDVKPANVLVTSEGTPKLIDFGIAAASREANLKPDAMTFGARLFSPGFAAPEQINGDVVTVATDVFSLGALAYHLLTGRPPHGIDDSALNYSLAVTTRDVLPASVAAGAAGRSAGDIRALRGDLDAILTKALARDPQARYSAAADLRADLSRFLECRPVRARRAGVIYGFAKFTQRNSWACALGALLFVSVLVGGAVMAVQMHRETVARNMAARRDEFLESLLKSADPRGGRRNISVAELLDSAASALDGKLSSEPLVEASMLGVIAQTNNGLGRYAEGLIANDRQLALLRNQSAGKLELGQALALRGELLREQGRWREAESVLRDAVALLRPTHLAADLCGALYVLGVVQGHVNREEDALRTFHEVIEIESHGDSHLQQQRMFPFHALAVNLANLGRYPEALGYAREAVDVAQHALPPEHPDLLSLETTYAAALVSSQQYAEAEALYRRVIAAQDRVLGDDHKDTLLTQLMLADELLDLRRDVEAGALALSVARRLETLLGVDNLYTQLAWQEYASAICNTGQVGAGLETLQRVQSVWQRLLPAGDRLAYATQLSIGTCLYRAQRYSEAEVDLLAAVAGLEAARGPAYRRTQQAYQALRDLYLATSRDIEVSRWTAKLGK